MDFRWIQQDYIGVIKRLQIYPVDPVDSWWIVVDFWWISGGLLVDLVDMWWIVVDFWWISGGSGRHVVDCGGLWWIVVDF